MKAYSHDLRERVLRAVDQGYHRADIIKLFGVSRATIKRYLKQRRETGEVSVKRIPGRSPKKFAPLQAGLVAQLEAHPDATLETYCQLWLEQQGVQVSTSTMSRAIRRVGWTRKKNYIGNLSLLSFSSSTARLFHQNGGRRVSNAWQTSIVAPQTRSIIAVSSQYSLLAS